MAAAANPSSRPKAVHARPDAIFIPDEPAHLQAEPGGAPLLDCSALWPKPLQTRAHHSTLSPAAQLQLGPTLANAVQHPCHSHSLTSFRIIGVNFECSCDLCGMHCSKTEQPDLIVKLTTDLAHAEDVETVFQIVWVCTESCCRRPDTMPLFTICARCMWSDTQSQRSAGLSVTLFS